MAVLSRSCKYFNYFSFGWHKIMQFSMGGPCEQIRSDGYRRSRPRTQGGPLGIENVE